MISRNKAMFLILLFLVVGVALSGCTSSEISSGGQQQAPEAASDKKGDTVLTGTITQAGEKFFLQQSGELQDIESYSIDLASYTGKNVTVTGQFSGDTLFVSKIE